MRKATYLRHQLARGNDSTATDIDDVRQQAPWAAEIAEIEGGWIAFESEDDYATWCGQV